jgi:hypothetical protein
VAVLDIEGNVLRIGSGFFIDRDGTLVTNDHVLDGAYRAEIKTADGDIYPIDSVSRSGFIIYCSSALAAKKALVSFTITGDRASRPIRLGMAINPLKVSDKDQTKSSLATAPTPTKSTNA